MGKWMCIIICLLAGAANIPFIVRSGWFPNAIGLAFCWGLALFVIINK